LRSAASALMWLQFAATAASAPLLPPAALLPLGALAGADTAARTLSVATCAGGAAAARDTEGKSRGAAPGPEACAGTRCVTAYGRASCPARTPSSPSTEQVQTYKLVTVWMSTLWGTARPGLCAAGASGGAHGGVARRSGGAGRAAEKQERQQARYQARPPA
jgi:hypothetical protein